MNLKLAVIGVGYWGKNLVRNFSQLNVLSAICDENSLQAAAIAKQYQCQSLSWENILQDKSIGAVVIAVPAEHHYECTKQALEAGKHVFVEKPLALHVAHAKALCELALRVNRTLMVGHLLQYHPAFLELQKLVQKGALGKLQYIYSNRLNLGKFRTEENILWSFAPHDISMILSLAGEMPESVYAVGASHLNPDIQDVTTTHLSFKSGIQSHIFVSWLHPFKEQKLVVVGEQGMAVFDDRLDFGEKLKLYFHKITWKNSSPHPEKAEAEHILLDASEPLKQECQHFIDSIQHQTQPRTDGEEGLRVLQVLDAAQRSLEQHKTITMKDKETPYFKHATAEVAHGAMIGSGTKIWHFSHVLNGVKVGKDCVIGQNVMLGPDVVIGDQCKIQNNVSLYKGVTLEDGVFCGPSCVFTNVNTPRATIERKTEFKITYVESGVTIGANATIICGVRLGAYAFVGAGAVVTKSVKPHALVIGNPARQVGWVSHAGEVLGEGLVCPREGRQYQVNSKSQLEEALVEVLMHSNE